MKKYYPLAVVCLLAMGACQAPTEADEQDMTMIDNPLLMEWDTPFGVPPFDKIEDEHYLPAFRAAIAAHKSEIDAILTNSEEPTFANTIEALERSGKALTKVANVFFAINSAHSNDSIRSVATIMAPELSAHSDDINLNAELFKKVAAVHSQIDDLNLNSEQKRLLEETHKNFVRAGVSLQGADKEKLREINGRLASLSQEFGQNLLAETNDFDLHVTDRKDFGNLPESLVSVAAGEAKARDHDSGWSFTLQRPSINPFLQYSTNRDLRKKLFDGYALRGDNDNDHDNKAILEEMASLRVTKANLLGYDTHADYVLANSMAENPKAVYDFMDKVWPSAIAMAKAERKALTQTMKADGIDADLEGSDWRHYVEKVRKERYDFDEEAMRPYFEFTAVRDGAFTLATKLFGLTFKELDNLPKWHPDQQVFEVLEEDGSHLGILYMDFFARESKRGGAWMNDLVAQSKLDGEVSPIVTNNFNFPPATADGPSLLSFSESQTLFHEFGHALHGLFSNVTYESLSGTNVPRDFVEFPSQVMENWMSEPEVLKLYAKHYKTGDPIPEELIAKMNAANNFNQGFGTVEYMAAAYLDMGWHTLKDSERKDARAFEKQEMERIGLIDEIIPRYRSTYFAHIFSGGYSSGYYSYLWSEVLDADAFQAFKETDIFDRETAARYRKMLSMGGSKPGMELYKDFRGKAPEIEPLLIKKGFLEQ